MKMREQELALALGNRYIVLLNKVSALMETKGLVSIKTFTALSKIRRR